MVFGADIGGTHIRVGRLEGKKLQESIIEEVAGSPEAVAQQLVEMLLRLGAAGMVRLGVGCAGHIDHKRGVVLFSPHLKWRDVAFGEELVRAAGGAGLEVELRLENDVNAAAWGEYVAGAGEGAGSVAAIFVGTGIGGGIVIEGRLLRGAHGGAAEIGHATYIAGGRLCACGRRGCFEAYAGGSAISEAFAQKTGLHLKASEIWARRKKEKAAEEVFNQATGALAHLLLSLSAIVDVERFVLGGGVMRRCRGLAEEVWKAYKGMVEATWGVAAVVVEAKLGEKAALVGAGLLAV